MGNVWSATGEVDRPEGELKSRGLFEVFLAMYTY
jgi:hypothetical protein